MKTQTDKDLYAILGLDKEATDEQIKKSFRKLSMQYHPDRQVDKTDEEKKEAEEKFKEINEAYSVLSDPDKRRRYDMTGSFDPTDFFANFAANFGGFGGPDMDISDMFGGMFGKKASEENRRRMQTKPGSAIQTRVPLTIKDVYSGATKKMKVKRNVRCSGCGGTRGKMGECPHCHGKGMTSETGMTPFGPSTQIKPCMHCEGTGETVMEPCPKCKGSGYEQKEEIIEVKFPAGVPDGAGITVNGKGNESLSPLGVTGLFVAIAKWNFDTEKYMINGLNVSEKVEIPYEDCILGTTYRLTLPDGEETDVTIPPLTVPGKDIIVPKKGIQGNYGQRGDYYLTVNYIFPDTLSDKEKELLGQIKGLHQNDMPDSPEKPDNIKGEDITINL